MQSKLYKELTGNAAVIDSVNEGTWILMGLLNLEYKCLVDIDSENCIRMHDQIRDLGRYLVEKEPFGCGLRL